jgi:hypothetical protein
VFELPLASRPTPTAPQQQTLPQQNNNNKLIKVCKYPRMITTVNRNVPASFKVLQRSSGQYAPFHFD